MTAILPRPATPVAPNPLSLHLVALLDAALLEAHQQRLQLAAVIDAMVAEQMVVPRNRMEHPFTEQELAEIEAQYRAHWAATALNAVKEQQ